MRGNRDGDWRRELSRGDAERNCWKNLNAPCVFRKAMNPKFKICAIIVIVTAAFALPIWQRTQIKRLETENTQLRAEAAQLPEMKRQLDRLHKVEVDATELDRLRGLQSELLQLRARVNTGQRAVSEVAELKSELDRQKQESAATNQFSGAIGEAAKGMMEQQMSARLTRMKAKLNFTPQQEEAVNGILRQQVERSTEFAQKMFSGKLSREEMTKAQQEMGDPEGQIKALLSPDQQTAYQQFKQEENAANARLMANSEMLQLQNAIGLNQEQQDQVVAVLYEQTMKQMAGDMKSGPKDGNADAWIEQQLGQKVKALEKVLTPEQLEGYRRLQEAQMKMMKIMMPKEAAPPSPGEPRR
jgi:hypothetical protein